MADYRDKTSPFCEFLSHIFKIVFPKYIFFFSIPSSKVSRNTCKLSHKVRNGQIYPLEVQILSISKKNFKLKLAFNFRLSKTYSFNPSLKSTLVLYVFERLWQETKILFEKSKLNFVNFTWSLLSSVAINVNICLCVCVSVCSLFESNVQCPMSKLFRFWESLGKNNGNNWSQIWKLCS